MSHHAHFGAGLEADRIESQLRRAHRWDLPRTPRPYLQPAPRPAAVRVAADAAAPRRRLPRSLAPASLASLLANAAVLALMAALPAPRTQHRAEPPMRIVIAEPRAATPLESLPVDIATPLGQQSRWTHFDQPISRPAQHTAPLAVPSVVDRFVGNPLSVSPAAGGDVVVGGDAGRASRGSELDGAEFLGVRARGQRFVFLLDNTTDMFGPAWRQSKREVLAAVSRLQAPQRFAVVLVDGSVYQRPHRHDMRPARPDAAPLLAVWLDAQPLVDRGDAAAAMQAAIKMRPDAVYLIGGEGFPDSDVAPIRSHNKRIDDEQIKMPAAVVHAIAITPAAEQAGPLRRIAAQNGGHFFHLPVEW